MTTYSQEFQELLTLTREYLSQNYTKGQFLFTDPLSPKEPRDTPPAKPTSTEKKIEPPTLSKSNRYSPPPRQPPKQTTQIEPPKTPTPTAMAPEQKKPTIPTASPINAPKEIVNFSLEPPGSPQPVDFKNIKTAMQQLFPAISIIDQIPIAEKLLSKPMLLFIISEQAQEIHQLAENIVNAVTAKLGPAQLVLAKEMEKKLTEPQNWLMILTSLLPSDQTLFSKIFKGETPVESVDLAKCLQDPLEKKALWDKLKRLM